MWMGAKDGVGLSEVKARPVHSFVIYSPYLLSSVPVISTSENTFISRGLAPAQVKLDQDHVM